MWQRSTEENVYSSPPPPTSLLIKLPVMNPPAFHACHRNTHRSGLLVRRPQNRKFIQEISFIQQTL